MTIMFKENHQLIIFMSNNEYVEIPSTSIRMRVIANSDSSEDQNNKKIFLNY